MSQKKGIAGMGKPAGGMGKLPKKDDNSSYWEAQKQMHDRIRDERKRWNSAEVKWRQNG